MNRTRSRIAIPHAITGFPERALHYVSGYHKGFSLEHRVYNILAFSIVIFSFLVGLFNHYLGIHWMTTLAGFAGCLVAAVLFYISRFIGRFNGLTIYAMMFAGIVILGVIYPYDGGSQGAWIFGTLTLIIVFITISPNKAQVIVLAIWLSYVLGLFTIEYFNEEWVLGYNSRRERLLDFMVTFAYCLSLMALTIITFKRSYNREREKVTLQNAELARKNQQIEILMKELNHRVKNNLQVVTSLLNLQSARIKDPEARNAVLDGRNRLLSMVLIHQKLYQNERPTEINMKEYLIELSDNIVMTNRSVAHDDFLFLNIEDIIFKVEHAVPVGLIVNELVTNSVKHAFDEENVNNRISIYFRKMQKGFSLIIEDNGKGYTGSPKDSFGLQLVRSLVEQLDGTLNISSKKGTEINIEFTV